MGINPLPQPIARGQSSLPPHALGCLAVREESIGYDLARLPPGSVVVRPEVWQIVRRYTRLSRSTAGVPCHDPSRHQLVGVGVEGRAWWYVLELLAHRWVVVVGSIGVYLGDLPTCGIGSPPEVWSVA